MMMHKITVGCIRKNRANQVWIDQSGPKEERGHAVQEKGQSLHEDLYRQDCGFPPEQYQHFSCR